MAQVAYLTKNKQSITDSGVIHGSTNYSNRGKGLSYRYPLIHAALLNNYSSESCCPQYGEPIILAEEMLQRTCSKWYLCEPTKGFKQRIAGNECITLYLIPSNHEGIVCQRNPERCCRDMGMENIEFTIDLDAEYLDNTLNILFFNYNCHHLHINILADNILLRPAPGQPGSCRCGNTASPACDYDLCYSCCNGCSRHEVVDSQEPSGQPGSCCCGQTASPACDYQLCHSCCNGCSRHAYAETETESEEPARPPPGQPGSCSCGQTASPLCDYRLCSSCCNGCSRHYAETESEEPHRPPAGQPGSCRCGQIASPACDYRLCSHCCAGCSRHAAAQDTALDTDSEESEQHYVAAPVQQQQQQRCSCGQLASSVCVGLQCSSCCRNNSCSRHFPNSAAAGSSGAQTAAARSSTAGAAAPAQQQQQQQSFIRLGGGVQVFSSGIAQAASRTLQAQQQQSVPISRMGGGGGLQVQPLSSAGPSSSSSSRRQDWGAVGDFGYPGLDGSTAGAVGASSSQPRSSQTAAGSSSSGGGSSSGSSAVLQLRQQLVRLLSEYTSSPSCTAAHTQPACANLVQGMIDLAADSNLWQQAEAGSSSSSNNAAGASCRAAETSTTAPSARLAAATAAAAAGGGGGYVDVEEHLHQLTHCVVCLDAPRSVVLLPCKHMVLCQGCSRHLQQLAARDAVPGSGSRSHAQCPVCRVPATQHMQGVILS